jgi:hypothetical protein
MGTVLIAVFGIIALMLTSITSFMLMPVEHKIYTEGNLTGKAAQIAETQYNVFMIGPPVFVGAIFLSLYIQAARRQSDEVYE